MEKYEYKVSAGGRVNVIGEHIDYCGGKVFPASLSLKNTVYVRRNNSDKINIAFTTLPDKVTLDINKLESYENLKYGNYQAGCAYVWKTAGHTLLGCDILTDCTVPFGSGLSSSAAIEVSTLTAFAVIAGEKVDKKEIALLAQKAEREYAHVNCGIMDQYASANGEKDKAILLDCDKIEHKLVPFCLGDYALVITNCNKPHNLRESKYNERRAETEEALKLLQKNLKVKNLAEISIEDFEKNSYLLSGKVLNRAKHVIYECDRVNKAVEYMEKGDLVSLGKVLNASHKSLKELYEVTGIELDTLAETAQSFNDCLGSRMTGAGFGGCTISIVKKDKIKEFEKYVGENYKKVIGYDCSFYIAEIADGILIESL